MILEGLVTTIGSDGAANVAPMGPRVGADGDMRRFWLRPFRTSTTCRNLKATGQGVFHVTDDVLLLARAAVETVRDAPGVPAAKVRGLVLSACCRYYEFEVAEVDESGERVGFEVRTLLEARVRDFFGFNRAKHAVLEAAIAATRLDLLPAEAVARDFVAWGAIVAKTGGPDEARAFALLESYVADHGRRRGPPGGHADA